MRCSLFCPSSSSGMCRLPGERRLASVVCLVWGSRKVLKLSADEFVRLMPLAEPSVSPLRRLQRYRKELASYLEVSNDGPDEKWCLVRIKYSLIPPTYIKNQDFFSSTLGTPPLTSDFESTHNNQPHTFTCFRSKSCLQKAQVYIARCLRWRVVLLPIKYFKRYHPK